MFDNCVICKILDREYAHRLLNGEVFMRSLFEFGSWDVNHKFRDDTVNNEFRGDISEGAVAVYGDPNKNPALDGVPQTLKEMIRSSVNIEANELLYFKIYSLYKLKFHNGKFINPDPQIKLFGDSVVVFTNFQEFLKRLLKKIIELKMDNCAFYFDKVNYYNESQNTELMPLFNKNERYKWQNEMRIAFSKLVDLKDRKTGRTIKTLDRDLNRMTINIGDIRDIAFIMSVDDFIDLKRVNETKFVSIYTKERKTTAELIIKDTRKFLKDFKPLAIKPSFVIW